MEPPKQGRKRKALTLERFAAAKSVKYDYKAKRQAAADKASKQQAILNKRLRKAKKAVAGKQAAAGLSRPSYPLPWEEEREPVGETAAKGQRGESELDRRRALARAGPAPDDSASDDDAIGDASDSEPADEEGKSACELELPAEPAHSRQLPTSKGQKPRNSRQQSSHPHAEQRGSSRGGKGAEGGGSGVEREGVRGEKGAERGTGEKGRREKRGGGEGELPAQKESKEGSAPEKRSLKTEEEGLPKPPLLRGKALQTERKRQERAAQAGQGKFANSYEKAMALKAEKDAAKAAAVEAAQRRQRKLLAEQGRRKDQTKVMRKRTQKGQPVMKYRVDKILQKLQGST